MTRTTSWLAILACAIALSGCVSSNRPLGLPVWAEIQGTWQVENDVYEVQLLPDGSLSMAWIEWNEKEKRFNLRNAELVVSVDEGATYLNVRGYLDNPEAKDRYCIYRVLPSTSSMPGESGAEAGLGFALVTLIEPSEHLFRKAIEEGRLSGETGEFHTFVDAPELAHFVDPAKFTEQFDVEMQMPVLRTFKAAGPHGEDTVLNQGHQAHMECLPEALQQRKAANVRERLKSLKSELEHQLDQPVEIAEPEAAQWARTLNIDPEQWSRLMAPIPPVEQRYHFDKKGIATSAWLSAADFSSYLTCLDSRGFGLVNVSGAKHARFWVAKGGFGLFEFTVHME